MLSKPGASSERLLDSDTFLTRDLAAQALADVGIPTTTSTLESLASKGDGPPYVVINRRAVYRRSELLKWIESRTAQAGAA